MSEETFDEHILADKLNKLNNSQQSIESLSRWCISHRKKAKQIVETWDNLFKSVQREQRVSFLYLSNDILQNSRRKGREFVNEYWKVLPAALKHVYENDGDHGKKAASRLVDIWEERKVFGSRGQNLKDEMLGKSPPPPVSKGKSLNSIKIVKRDANSLRVKLAVGGIPEKILTAFQSVHDENAEEEGALSKCRDAVHLIVEMDKDVEDKSANGNLQGSALVDEILEHEHILRQCAGQLENAEALRVALVSQLKEALQDQETKLEIIRTKLQVARGLIEQAVNMRQRMTSAPLPVASTDNNSPSLETMRVFESGLPANKPASASLLPPPPAHPVVSFSTSKNSEEESKKAAAAAVAAKLAASTSSALMLTSVLSSLVAEEVASMRSGFSSSLPMFPSEKRQKHEKPMAVSEDNSSDMGNVPYFTSIPQQPLSNVQLTPPRSMQAISQANQIQGQFLPLPPPPPPPVPSSNSSVSQFVQSAGLVMGIKPYGYGGGGNLPSAPAPPSHVAMGLARREQQPSQLPSTQQHQQPQSQRHHHQQSANSGYYRPSGVGFYGQSHHPTPPPLPRR